MLKYFVQFNEFIFERKTKKKQLNLTNSFFIVLMMIEFDFQIPINFDFD